MICDAHCHLDLMENMLEFINEIEKINVEIWNKINEKNQKTMKRNYLFDNVSEMVEDYLTDKKDD